VSKTLEVLIKGLGSDLAHRHSSQTSVICICATPVCGSGSAYGFVAIGGCFGLRNRREHLDHFRQQPPRTVEQHIPSPVQETGAPQPQRCPRMSIRFEPEKGLGPTQMRDRLAL
jgi:hypothetical protein